jgi:hypothetical protein
VSRTRRLAAALALCATAVAGCGIGPGKDEGDISLTVTRDYGRRVMLEKTDSIRQSDTVLRVLDRNVDLSTRYGGGFVQSIDGLAGTQSGGRSSDWFFYVNGIESPIGSAQYDPSGGDRIWWDYRDWTTAMRVPAVVGSWPEPFVHGFQGRRWPTHIDCMARASTCTSVGSRLRSAGAGISDAPTGSISVEVGTWDAIRQHPPADLLANGPDQSGVFARFVGTGKKPLLDLLDLSGNSIGSLGKCEGLIAALRPGDGPPTWVVAGTDACGVAAAADVLDPEHLRNRYALVTSPGAAGTFGVPVP